MHCQKKYLGGERRLGGELSRAGDARQEGLLGALRGTAKSSECSQDKSSVVVATCSNHQCSHSECGHGKCGLAMVGAAIASAAIVIMIVAMVIVVMVLP